MASAQCWKFTPALCSCAAFSSGKTLTGALVPCNAYLSCRRNPTYNASRIVYCVVLAVLLGTIYLWKGQARYDPLCFCGSAGAGVLRSTGSSTCVYL
jgi:hypothetical protein